MIKQSVLRENGTVTLLIEQSSGQTVARDYWIRAAVVWPMHTRDGMTGGLLVGLWDIQKERLLIDYERKFVAVDHVISGGKLIHRGISDDMQLLWSRYRTRRVYYSGDESEHDRYRIMVARSKQIDPKPSFVRVTLDIDAVKRWTEMDRFKIQKGTMLYNELGQYVANEGTEATPLILALATLIAGAEEYPYRAVTS